jgi:2,3-bisphosphoglycerate-dependent phosphoglycerate mutase
MDELAWLGTVRHGESEGNVAAQRAESSGAERVDIDLPDPEVPLTATGREQSAAIGRWLAGLPARERPDVVIASPYRRAEQTAEIAVAVASSSGVALRLLMDERLRDREVGVLDRMTRRGIATHLPEEAARRKRLGRFYYRPPGGESWADVALRLRCALGDLRREYPDRRVLLVTHDADMFLLRYIIEGLSPARLMELAAAAGLDNGALTAWSRTGDGLRLVCHNDTGHLSGLGTRVTRRHEV